MQLIDQCTLLYTTSMYYRASFCQGNVVIGRLYLNLLTGVYNSLVSYLEFAHSNIA